MLFFAMTKPKQKASILIKVLLVVLALGVVIPSLYGMLLNVNAFERFAAKEQYPGEPVRVDAPVLDIESLAVWQELQSIYKLQ